jgi:hypothetical protein
MGRHESVASGRGTAGTSESLRQALEGRQFNSLEEIQAFVEHHTLQQNQRALGEFHGLSPEQMHRLLNFPFTSPQLVGFPEVLDTGPKAPILTLFDLLVGAIGEQGLKPTAKGNLPRKFCRESALVYWGEQRYRENTQFGGINREDDFLDLHVTRLVAELAGLIRNTRVGSFSAGTAEHYWPGAVWQASTRGFSEPISNSSTGAIEIATWSCSLPRPSIT